MGWHVETELLKVFREVASRIEIGIFNSEAGE
jgi:hypothetical protein